MLVRTIEQPPRVFAVAGSKRLPGEQDVGNAAEHSIARHALRDIRGIGWRRQTVIVGFAQIATQLGMARVSVDRIFADRFEQTP